MSVSQTRIRVRYAETDQMGVVYYANFFVWFEVGRVELLRQLGFHYKQMEIEDDCRIPVVEANCRYKSPARYDDELLLETRVLVLRRSVIKFGYRLMRPGDEAAYFACGRGNHPRHRRPVDAEDSSAQEVCCHPRTVRDSPFRILTLCTCSLITPAGEMI